MAVPQQGMEVAEIQGNRRTCGFVGAGYAGSKRTADVMRRRADGDVRSDFAVMQGKRESKRTLQEAAPLRCRTSSDVRIKLLDERR